MKIDANKIWTNKSSKVVILEHHPLIMGDIECKISNEQYFQWGIVYQMFNSGDFSELIHNDPEHDLSINIYKNVTKSGLHRISARSLVLPCVEVIS